MVAKEKEQIRKMRKEPPRPAQQQPVIQPHFYQKRRPPAGLVDVLYSCSNFSLRMKRQFSLCVCVCVCTVNDNQCILFFSGGTRGRGEASRGRRQNQRSFQRTPDGNSYN